MCRTFPVRNDLHRSYDLQVFDEHNVTGRRQVTHNYNMNVCGGSTVCFYLNLGTRLNRFLPDQMLSTLQKRNYEKRNL